MIFFKPLIEVKSAKHLKKQKLMNYEDTKEISFKGWAMGV